MPNFRSGFLVRGEGLGTTSQTITLIADNQVINPAGQAMINLESDNTTATNRTFTILGSTLEGQVLTFVFTSGSSTAADLQDTGNVLLTAAWQPTQGQSLTLIWNARLSKWVELARALN